MIEMLRLNVFILVLKTVRQNTTILDTRIVFSLKENYSKKTETLKRNLIQFERKYHAYTNKYGYFANVTSVFTTTFCADLVSNQYLES